ncbi:hypothetical protein D3C81_2054550 [compost metagenome]
MDMRLVLSEQLHVALIIHGPKACRHRDQTAILCHNPILRMSRDNPRSEKSEGLFDYFILTREIVCLQ